MTDGIIPIVDPWIIVHQPEDKLETILAGPPDTNYERFGIVIADVIRHVANRFNVEEADVMNWVNREIDDPTTELTGSKLQ